MKQPLRALAVVLPAFLLLTPSGALAQGPPPDTARRAELLAKYDTNGDGKLSKAEIEAARPREQPSASNAATAGPRHENTAHRRGGELKNDAVIQALLEKFDRDGDGKLDLNEMAALRAALKKDGE